jgi:hypothetical protein
VLGKQLLNSSPRDLLPQNRRCLGSAAVLPHLFGISVTRVTTVEKPANQPPARLATAASKHRIRAAMPFSTGKAVDIAFGIFLSSLFAYYLPQYVEWVPEFSIWIFLLIIAINFASFLT